MEIRKTAAYEWFDSIGKPILGILFTLVVLALFVMRVAVPAFKAENAEGELKSKVGATDAGRFALVQLGECQAGGRMFSERSEVECVVPVVAAAKLLKGETFAHEVSRSLAIWIDRRTSLEH
jgi:hypothetical protein